MRKGFEPRKKLRDIVLACVVDISFTRLIIQVTSVLVTPDDDVYVASVPPGVLHRWHGNRLKEVARLADGVTDTSSRSSSRITSRTPSRISRSVTVAALVSAE